MSDRICSVDGCQGQNHARGFCDRHYRRFRRCGTTDFRTREEYFWIKVDRRGPDECWPWTGCLRPDGYGSFWTGSRVTSSSRAAYELLVSPIAAGLSVLHACDNPACVNPAHLSLGTNAENMAQMARRKRQHRGPVNEDIALRVRAAAVLGRRQASIAFCSGLSPQKVSRIILGEIWAHVTVE